MPPPEFDPFAYIAKVSWIFARSMPQWPHQYTVREWRPDLIAEFQALADLILAEGMVKPWPWTEPRVGRAGLPTCELCGHDHGYARYHHRYLVFDAFEYWVMENVINRARLEDQTWPYDGPPPIRRYTTQGAIDE